MIRRALVIVFETFALCVFLVAVGLFWAAHYVDTDDFRQQFTEAVGALTGQTVVLNGELDLALYPTLSLKVYDLAMHEKGAPSGVPLVRFDVLRVSARLIPLIAKNLEIRTIVVEGMQVNIHRSKAGTFNWQSLADEAGPKQDDGVVTSYQFDSISLDGLEVVNATVSYSDDMEGQRLGLKGIALRVGRIVQGGDIPFTAKSGFSWKNGGISSDLILKGMVVFDEVTGNVALDHASAYATIGGPFLPPGASPGELTAQIDVDWDKRVVALDHLRLHFLGLRGEGAVKSGNLSRDLGCEGHVTIQPFKPADIVSRYFPKAPLTSVDGLKSGSFTSFFQVNEKGVTLKDMAVALDDLTVRGNVAMQGFLHPQFSFNLRGDMVDLDRYLPLFKTDTPFVWGDFQLDFFRAFRGQGKVRADGFKVLDTVISDVRLTLKADGKSIAADAVARRKGQGAVNGKAEFMLGGNNGKASTFAVKAALTAESGKEGFDFLNKGKQQLTGAGLLKADVQVARMPCPAEGRSIDLLRHLSVDASLHLGAGKVHVKDDSGKSFEQSYSTASAILKTTPRSSNTPFEYGFDVEAAIRGQDGKPLESFALSAVGPFEWGLESGHVASPGLAMKGHVYSTLYTPRSSRASAGGTVSFDSKKKIVALIDGSAKALETTVKVSARFTDVDKQFKAAGKIEIPRANIHRIVYLLAQKKLDLEDPEALKSARLTADFTASETGFTMDKLEGDLDGLPISGQIVGQEWKHPMLAFSLTAGKFDLDRYLPRSDDLTVEELRAGKVAKKAPPVDLPLAFLGWLRLNGKAHFEEFKLADIRAESLSAMLRADNREIDIFGAKGTVHGGPLGGRWTGTVGESSLSTHLKLHVEGMQAGPLMRDMLEREYIRGVSDVDIDLKSFGRTDDDIVKNLDGICKVRIQDGSFRFTGYDKVAKPEKEESTSMMNPGRGSQKATRTVFKQATVDFTVKKGVFTVDKFHVQAPPLLQSHGSGSFSLPDDNIHLSIRNDFVAVPSVPIEITGKLSDPQVNVPKGKIITDTARNILSLPEKSFNFLRDLFGQ